MTRQATGAIDIGDVRNLDEGGLVENAVAVTSLERDDVERGKRALAKHVVGFVKRVATSRLVHIVAVQIVAEQELRLIAPA